MFQINKMDSLDHPPLFHIETGHYFNCIHKFSFFSLGNTNLILSYHTYSHYMSFFTISYLILHTLIFYINFFLTLKGDSLTM